MNNSLAKLDQLFEILGNEQTAVGRTSLGVFVDLVNQGVRVDFPTEKLLEPLRDRENLFRRFVDEFDSVIADAAFSPIVHKPPAKLRLRTEYGVSTTDVGQNRMLPALRVGQSDLMGLAGVTAIAAVGSRTEETTKHAMLRMKNG